MKEEDLDCNVNKSYDNHYSLKIPKRIENNPSDNFCDLDGSNYVICDATKNDCPIIYASESFLKLTGYDLNEVIGHNCRFLQGPETDKYTIKKLSHAVKNGIECKEIILNYTKNKECCFWNELKLVPLKDSEGNVVQILGIQKIVSKLEAMKIHRENKVTNIKKNKKRSLKPIHTFYSRKSIIGIRRGKIKREDL